ncbi:hypothetical protein SFUMM280S_10462 [Streptomyces fumanus]
MLPDIDGFGVLDELRRSGTMVPVVFLTARDQVADRVAGLTRGGDDYLVKPFAVEELMARLRTVLRRSAGPGFPRSVLRVGDLTMDEDTREVRRGGTLIALTPTEYEVLRYLMRKSPAVLTKAQILDHVWEYGFGGRSNVVELVVSRLRRKLDEAGEAGGPLIHTVRGFGYALRRTAPVIRRLWRSWRRLRLGTRLALGLGVLSLAVFAVVGTALTASMREYLQARLVDQMKLVQVVQSKDAATHGTVERQPYYGWYTAVYDVTGGSADLRRPADVPADSGALTDLAETRARAGQDLTRSVRIDGRGPYLLRACEVRPGVVLVSAAPLGDVENTMDRLIAVQVVAYGLALLALVVLGRRMLRRGLRPLSEMARTAHGIASHDLTRSAAQLPLRAAGRPGGREVEELRTAFNAMLEHIDASLAVRAEAERRLRRFVADASHGCAPRCHVRTGATPTSSSTRPPTSPGNGSGTWPGCGPCGAEPGASRSPPMAYEGSRPSSARETASIEVVVVLPWVPATASGRRPSIRAARASERWTTGTPSSAARASSGLSARIAEETTTQLASSARCSAACPMCTVAPSARSASAVAESFASLPATLAPRCARILAIPDIPAPPMPMKCGRSMAVGRPGAMLSPCACGSVRAVCGGQPMRCGARGPTSAGVCGGPGGRAGCPRP